MYYVNEGLAPGKAVPQLVLDALGAAVPPHAFAVALFVVGQGRADAHTVAGGLHISTGAARQALAFWARAGLLAEQGTQAEPPARPDGPLRGLLAELARLYARALSPGEKALFTGLYKQEGFDAEMILLTAQHYKAKGITNARYIQKVMHTWKQDGIQDFAEADERLRQEAAREEGYQRVAALAGVPELSYADKARVDRWFLEYGYTLEMVETAQLYAGQNSRSLPYLDGILRAWHGKGYGTPAEVSAAGHGATVRETPAAAVAPEDDILLNATYVPINKKK